MAHAITSDPWRAAGSASVTAINPGNATGYSEPIAAFSLPRTDWVIAAIDRINKLTHLPVGWDGHQGHPTDPSTAGFALDALRAIMGPSVPLPAIMPLSYGGILLEWHRKCWDVEIEIEAPNRVNVYTYSTVSKDEDEFSVKSDLSRLSPIIERISD